MQIIRSVDSTCRLIGKLDYGDDLIGALTQICEQHGVRLGRIEAIGAVQKARIGYYHQAEQTYQFKDFDQPMEILKLAGNISLRDGKSMVHAHITLSDSDGRAIGGHLAPGTVVFACEFIIEAYVGSDLVRGHDKTTGLPLWEE